MREVLPAGDLLERASAFGREIAASGKAAMVLYWKSLNRQIRARGKVESVSEAEADAYFASRHRDGIGERPGQLGIQAVAGGRVEAAPRLGEGQPWRLMCGRQGQAEQERGVGQHVRHGRP